MRQLFIALLLFAGAAGAQSSKISNLPPAVTPLQGNELITLVQGGFNSGNCLAVGPGGTCNTQTAIANVVGNMYQQCPPYSGWFNNTAGNAYALCQNTFVVQTVQVSPTGSITALPGGVIAATTVPASGIVGSITATNTTSVSGAGSWGNFTSGSDTTFGSENVLLSGVYAPTLGSIDSLGTLTGTATNGTYTNITPTGGTGTGARLTIVVSGGAVTSVTATTGGNNYTHGDTLSFSVTGGSGTAKVATLGGMQGIRDLHQYSGSYYTSVQDYQINSSIGYFNGETPYQWKNYNGGLINMRIDSSLNTLNGLKPPPVQEWEECNAWSDARADASWNPVTFFACNLTDSFVNGNGATSLSATLTGASGTGSVVTYTFAAMATVAKFGDTITITGTNGALYDQVCTVGGGTPTLTSVPCTSTKTGTWTSGGALVWQPTIYNMANRFNNNNSLGGINSVNAGANRYNVISYWDMPTNTASAGTDYERAVWIDGECSAATGSGTVLCQPIWVTTIGADNEVWAGFGNTPIGVSPGGPAAGSFTTGSFNGNFIQFGGTATFNGGTSNNPVNINTGSSTGHTNIGNAASTLVLNAGTVNGTSIIGVPNGGTGTGSTLAGLVRGNSSAMTAAEISGDCTTSGSNAINCTKTAGTVFGSFAVANTAAAPPITEASGNAFTPATNAGIAGVTGANAAQPGTYGEYQYVNCVGTTNGSQAVTMTIATPAVITWASAVQWAVSATNPTSWTCPIIFSTSGTLPTGLTAGTTVWVDGATVSGLNFDVSDTAAHALAGTNHIATSGTQSGTQTGTMGGSVTTTTWTPGVGINLQAGDWDCFSTWQALGATLTTETGYLSAVNTVSNAAPGSQNVQNFQSVRYSSVSSGSEQMNLTSPPTQELLASTTAVYGIGQVIFGGGTVTASALLRCRRMH